MHEEPTRFEQAGRRRPAHPLPRERDDRSIIIFLTVCTQNRRLTLANAGMHARLRAAWMEANHWLVGRYMIMPDHLHLFSAPNTIPPVRLGTGCVFGNPKSPKPSEQPRELSGKRILGIRNCAGVRATRRSGNMYETIRCGQAWSPDRRTGLTRGNQMCCAGVNEARPDGTIGHSAHD